MGDQNDNQISHADLYHKLGKLEGLMETMMTSVSSFQVAIKDLHSRIDNLEARQGALEKKRSSDYGATHALIGLGKDFAIPVLAIAVAWLLGREKLPENPEPQLVYPEERQHVQSSTKNPTPAMPGHENRQVR